MEASPRHLLRVVLSSRRLMAEVMSPATASPNIDGAIVAMASSSEPEFAAGERARLDRFPRRRVWDDRVAARVGEKLAARLRDLGVGAVRVDLAEELARPPHYRRPLAALFLAVGRSGVHVHGADQLKWP